MKQEQAHDFLNQMYPDKTWQFRGMENKAYFFDCVTEKDNAENEDDYEQMYLVCKKGNWEIIINHENKYSSPYKQPYNLANDLESFNDNQVGVKNSVGFDQYYYRYYGSTSQNYVEKLDNPENHFVQIIKDGLDISLPKGKRSTYELSKYIDFDKLTVTSHLNHENLLLDYYSYIEHRLCVLFSYEDENQLYKSICSNNYDDSIKDMLCVLEKIKNANLTQKYEVKLNPSLIGDIKHNISALKLEIKQFKYSSEQKERMYIVFKKIIQEVKNI